MPQLYDDSEALPTAVIYGVNLVVAMQSALRGLTPGRRLEFLVQCCEGYCQDCMRETGGMRCHCTNDE